MDARMKLTALLVAFAASFAFVSEAQAHRNSFTPTCAGGVAEYESTVGTRFSGEVFTGNEVKIASWDIVVGQGGHAESGSLPVPYTLTGSTSVYARWRFSSGESTGLNRVYMECGTPTTPTTSSPVPVSPAPVTSTPPTADTLVSPSVSAVAPAEECVPMAPITHRLRRHGNTLELAGFGLTHIRWFERGRLVGHGRVHVVKRPQVRHRIKVTARYGCADIKKRIVLRPQAQILPRFTG